MIGCYLDLDNMNIKWSKNGCDLGVAYEIPNNMRTLSYFPSICMKNAEIKFNFGYTQFKYQPGVSYNLFLFVFLLKRQHFL